MESLKIVSTVKAVSEAIARSIYASEYEPGTMLKEGDLANRFGVSRNTIREAMAGLQKSGLLEKKINRGVFVKKITLMDVIDIYHIRVLFECEAVRTIMTFGKVPDTIIQALEAVENYEAHQNQELWMTFASKDVDFHAAVVKAANSARLASLYETIASEVKLCMCQSKEVIPIEEHNRYSHRMVVDAMLSGDADEAIRLTKAHIDYAIQKFVEGYA